MNGCRNTQRVFGGSLINKWQTTAKFLTQKSTTKRQFWANTCPENNQFGNVKQVCTHKRCKDSMCLVSGQYLMIYSVCLIVSIDTVCVFLRFVCLFYLSSENVSIGACFCPLTVILDVFHLHAVFVWQEWADDPGGHPYPSSGFHKQLWSLCLSL